MPTDTFNASSTWTCPTGVTSVLLEAWGGGGGGGGRNATARGAAGGGGGEYAAEAALAVTPGNIYTVTVGAAGVQDGADGGDSTFAGDAVTVTAHGGPSASLNQTTASNGGTGSTNSVHHNGGASGAGSTTAANSGGGGEGGGKTATGGAGTSANPGVGGSGTEGGDGGNGGGSAGQPGVAGNAPGGAGGGGNSNSATLRAGGNGAAGRIQITYTPVTVINLSDTGATVTDSIASKRLRAVSDTGATVTETIAASRLRALADTGATVSETLQLRVIRPLGAPSPPASLVWDVDGFEDGPTLSTYFDSFSGSGIAVSTEQAHRGTHSLKINPSGSVGFGRKQLAGSPTVVVLRLYVYLTVIQPGGELITVAPASGLPLRFGVDTATGKFGIVWGGSSTFLSLGQVAATGIWYVVDVKVDVSANPWKADYRVNGAAGAQLTNAVAAGAVDHVDIGAS